MGKHDVALGLSEHGRKGSRIKTEISEISEEPKANDEWIKTKERWNVMQDEGYVLSNPAEAMAGSSGSLVAVKTIRKMLLKGNQ